MGYVLRRNEDGQYVTRPGSAKSYSRRLESARVFPTREAAESDACGNETVVNVNDILKGN